MHAIPNYFDRLYELKNHLPTGSSSSSSQQQAVAAAAAAAAREAWIEWRDTQLSSQLMLYRRFVSYWMERHAGNGENDRLYFSYESLVNEESGPGEALRLATFLERGIRESALEFAKVQYYGSLDDDEEEKEEMKDHDEKEEVGNIIAQDRKKESGPRPQHITTIKDGLSTGELIDRAVKDATSTMAGANDVPCVWKEVVYSTLSSSSFSKQQPLQVNVDGESYSVVADGGEWNSIERPFTPENLAEITNMLLELLNRWSRHQRVLTILSVYHRVVNREYLASTGALEEALSEHNIGDREQQLQVQKQPSEEQQHPSPLSKLPFHIIQASHPNAASIIATNWLMGLFEPQKDVAFMKTSWPQEPIQQSGRETTIDANIVMKTHNLDLLTLYKYIRREREFLCL